jgi:D-sedoheptulose 7-phosphate isomerase
MIQRISEIISQSILVKQMIHDDKRISDEIERIVNTCVIALKSGRRIFFCGNGGSAADAQHLAAELSGRFKIDRHALNAESLGLNYSFITAVANDYNYEEVMKRELEAKADRGDVLFALSTSGKSPNILEALKQGRKMMMVTVGLTGAGGGQMGALCDYIIEVPSTETPRVQEAHMMLGHVICELVEHQMFL